MTKRTAWILLGFLAMVVAFAPLPVSSSSPQARNFRLEARQFAFSPSELFVNPGDILTLELVSTDVVHGIYIDGYDLSVEADPGRTATLTFIADKPGSFRFRCHVTCGAMHPFMIGKLTVGTNNWLYRSIGFSVLAVLGLLLFPRTDPKIKL
ncbi:MAG: cupredoxin domain-containing protein [Anaerolineales bacterium]|nr:cupredoxin domain-containing protein [Anaerolineales bacterium]NUQ86257.1 cupredoxin domain-containing protein [Anaerolineales bacterium]